MQKVTATKAEVIIRTQTDAVPREHTWCQCSFMTEGHSVSDVCLVLKQDCTFYQGADYKQLNYNVPHLC